MANDSTISWAEDAFGPASHNQYLCKLVASSINLVLQLSLLVLWSVSPRTSTSIPAATLGLANAIIIIGLSYVEDRKSTRPSSLLTVYLLLSILFDATQARTLWLTHRIPTAAVQSASTGTKLAMLLLEMREKTFYLQAPYRDYPPEATSGIVNLSFVWWINRLFITGYRKLMGNRDLYDLEPGLASGLAGERLKREWENHGPRKASSLPLVFAQPFLIMAAVQHVERPMTTETRNRGYGLIGATFLVYLGIAVSNVHYRQRFSRVSTLFRGLTQRMVKLGGVRWQAKSAALTLMSTDVDGIIEHLENMNDVWARTRGGY
ncbi:hypothetical protein AFLA_005980 [Aspergillus flavus NRRL3357]|nr:hypothetical protein AFLA_005980 [Aspergillus flavus NRRL3357]